LAKFINLFL